MTSKWPDSATWSKSRRSKSRQPERRDYPSNRTVTNCYDDNGRIAWASVSLTAANCQQGAQVEPSNSYASLIGYAPHGAMTSLTYGNGLTESTSFNSRLQPTQIQAGSLTLQYGYGTTNNNGNLLTQTIQGTWTQNYLYDGANRLLQAAENSAAPSTPGCVDGNANWCETYGYDAFGNRRITARTKLTPSAVEAASYSSATNRIADSGWSYDAAGNILTDPLSGTYAYDAENRQKSAVVTGSGTTQYSYDGDGRRVVSNGLNGQTVFVYDAQGGLAAEYTAIPQPAVNTEYFTVDHLGSTRMVTDSQGNCVERHDYLSFGPEILRTGCPGYNAGVRQKFTGKERDAETGLDYFGARYFSGAQGRFTSADSPFADQHAEDPQSWNMYAYVRNNPLKNTDPDGRDCTNGVGACLSYLWGGVKAVLNAPYDLVNAPNRLTNALISPFTSYRLPDLVTSPLQATNAEEQQGMESATVVIAVSPLAEVGATALVDAVGTDARVETGAAAASDVPTSIPAGPSARPTAAQQRAINEMGDAHGCNTCGGTNPGTVDGHWVGDHQPPTALNSSGGAQVYQPQCLGCSRQQGGLVTAAKRAAQKAAEEAAKQKIAQ
jgi:RHS repeat-associated protein